MTLPNVSGAVSAWGGVIDFVLVGKRQVDFKTVEALYQRTTYGTRQPLSAQAVAIKPEGQRAWRWEVLHIAPPAPFGLDDIVIFDEVRYRVMSKKDYSKFGYLAYEIAQDYQK